MALGVKVLGRAMLGKNGETIHYEEDKSRRRFLSIIEISEDTAACTTTSDFIERESRPSRRR